MLQRESAYWLRKAATSGTRLCRWSLGFFMLTSPASSPLANEAFELATREGNPTVMAYLYYMQLLVCHHRGDLLGAENHCVAGQEFFDDPVFRRAPTNPAITVFEWAALNAWALGRADLARKRLAEVRAAVRPANPYDLAWSNRLEAALYLFTREYETAEALAARALDLCEKHR